MNTYVGVTSEPAAKIHNRALSINRNKEFEYKSGTISYHPDFMLNGDFFDKIILKV